MSNIYRFAHNQADVGMRQSRIFFPKRAMESGRKFSGSPINSSSVRNHIDESNAWNPHPYWSCPDRATCRQLRKKSRKNRRIDKRKAELSVRGIRARSREKLGSSAFFRIIENLPLWRIVTRHTEAEISRWAYQKSLPNQLINSKAGPKTRLPAIMR